MKKLRHYFELLGVRPDASPEEIEEAHRASIRALDPDRLSNDAFQRQRALAKLWEINEAYSVVKAVLKAHLPVDLDSVEKPPELVGPAAGEEGGDGAETAERGGGPAPGNDAAAAREATGVVAPHAPPTADGYRMNLPSLVPLQTLAWAMVAFLAGLCTGILLTRATAPRPVYEKTAGPARTIEQTAEAGDPRAQAILGAMYYDGEGVRQDYSQALGWYRKAAERGFAEAQYNLGFMYYMGRGVEPDRAEARRWFRKAAEQGDVKAREALQRMGESPP